MVNGREAELVTHIMGADEGAWAQTRTRRRRLEVRQFRVVRVKSDWFLCGAGSFFRKSLGPLLAVFVTDAHEPQHHNLFFLNSNIIIV